MLGLSRIVEAISTMTAVLLRRSAVSSCSAMSSVAVVAEPVLSAKMLHSSSGDEQRAGSQIALTGKLRTLQRHLLLLVRASCGALEQLLTSLESMDFEAACRMLQSKVVEVMTMLM